MLESLKNENYIVQTAILHSSLGQSGTLSRMVYRWSLLRRDTFVHVNLKRIDALGESTNETSFAENGFSNFVQGMMMTTVDEINYKPFA